MSADRSILMLAFALMGFAYLQNPLRDTLKAANEEITIPPGKENLPAEQVFQNIQILKGKRFSVGRSWPQTESVGLVYATLRRKQHGHS
jgi:hypothetical protein